MAEKAKASPTKLDRKKKSAETADKGHNMVELKELTGKFRESFNRIKDEQEKSNGEYSVDIGNLLEKAANQTGLSKTALRLALNEQRREIKLGKRLAEMAPSDQQGSLTAAEALGLQSPFGAYLKRQADKDSAAAVAASKK